MPCFIRVAPHYLPCQLMELLYVRQAYDKMDLEVVHHSTYKEGLFFIEAVTLNASHSFQDVAPLSLHCTANTEQPGHFFSCGEKGFSLPSVYLLYQISQEQGDYSTKLKMAAQANSWAGFHRFGVRWRGISDEYNVRESDISCDHRYRV